MGKRVILFLLVGLLVGALTGCGNQRDAAPTPVGEVTINLKASSFEPKTVTLPAGKVTKVIFVNETGNPHKIEIKDLISEITIQPRERRSFNLMPAKQAYTLTCKIHEQNGMVGVIIGQ